MVIVALLCVVCAVHAQQQNNVSFYIVAHQDDWQLFMGANAFNDILDYSETGPFPNGRKVVIIHTTAGNLNDKDDRLTCNCIDPMDTSVKKLEYWKVREAGVKNSIHLAACRQGGWGPNIPYPKNETVAINGHNITRYEFRNVTSYFLRLKTGEYDAWQHDENADVTAVDSSTTYLDWSDLVTTIYYIYKTEMASVAVPDSAQFNIPDIDQSVNPNDHAQHYQAGRAGFEAAQMMTRNNGNTYNANLFMGYNSQNMPENLVKPDAQNKAGLAAVYCLALLDRNAWVEWGHLFYEWTARNYNRTITTQQDAIKNTNVCGQDSLNLPKVKIYPNPASDVLNVKINIPLKTPLDLTVTDAGGKVKYMNTVTFTSGNTFAINTSGYINGYYMLTASINGKNISSTMFQVVH